MPLDARAWARSLAWESSAAFMALYGWGTPKYSSAAVLLMKTTLALSDSFSAGIAASTARAAPSTSMSRLACQAASPMPAPPLALQIRMSRPPRSSADAVTNARNASPSATSTAWLKTRTPRVSRSLRAVSRPPSLRAQSAISTPSSARDWAIDNPMPRLAAVTKAFLPARFNSIFELLEIGLEV